MANTQALSSDPALRNLDGMLPDLEALYKGVHSHPELSMRETATAGLAADRLRAAGYEVTTGVAKTGVAGLLRNDEGPTVMSRADMDALPIQGATALPYASKATATDREGKTVSVSHMCGHDMHVTWLAGATKLMAEASGAPRPPEITHYHLNVNNQDAAKQVVDAFRGHFGAERVQETGPAPASEDFGSFASQWHVLSVFWFVGGTDPRTYAKAKEANKINELPVNHSPKFAPVLHPTQQTGVEALVVAARAWLRE